MLFKQRLGWATGGLEAQTSMIQSVELLKRKQGEAGSPPQEGPSTGCLGGPERQGREDCHPLFTWANFIKGAVKQKHVDSIWPNTNPGSLGKLIIVTRLMIKSRDRRRPPRHGLLSIPFTVLTKPEARCLSSCGSGGCHGTKRTLPREEES